MSSTTEPQVLVIANPSGRAYGHKTHALDCPFVRGLMRKGVEYIQVPASSKADWDRCRHCGGGR